jgi:hypothetical protein
MYGQLGWPVPTDLAVNRPGDARRADDEGQLAGVGWPVQSTRKSRSGGARRSRPSRMSGASTQPGDGA